MGNKKKAYVVKKRQIMKKYMKKIEKRLYKLWSENTADYGKKLVWALNEELLTKIINTLKK